LHLPVFRLKLDYGCIVYGSACKFYFYSRLRKFNPIQNYGMQSRLCSSTSLSVEPNKPDQLELRRKKMSVQFLTSTFWSLGLIMCRATSAARPKWIDSVVHKSFLILLQFLQKLSNFYNIWHTVYRVHLQYNKYWVTRLTYVLLLHYPVNNFLPARRASAYCAPQTTELLQRYFEFRRSYLRTYGLRIGT